MKSVNAKLKIILQEKTYNLGEVGDIVLVAKGFARNYLFPTGKAILATKTSIQDIEIMKLNLLKTELEKRNQAVTCFEILNQQNLVIETRADVNGSLYGSISKQDILNKLTETYTISLSLKKEQIHFVEKEIKLLGEYKITVNLHEDNTAVMHLLIKRVV